MLFSEWVKKNEGKKINPDGVSGVQCVDLIKHYCHEVLGIKKSYFDAWGNAIDWYIDFAKKPWLTDNFVKIPYVKGTNIKRGDIVIFKSSGKYGHIAVCNGKQDSKGFEAYDENYKGTHAGMTLRTFDFDGNYKPLGFLRPKNQKNVIVPPTIKDGKYKLTNERGIYYGYGADSGRKKVKDLTADGKKHATKKIGDAYLKAGTEVTISGIKRLSSGNIWAKIPSGYLCIWEWKINKKFIK